MLKLIGATLVVLGGAALGRLLSEWERRRVREGEALIDFLRFVRVQILSFMTPRDEIFRLYENDVLANTGFLSSLKAEGNIAAAVQKTSADREVVHLLTAFDRELGRSFKEGQVAACDFYIARMETCLASQKERLPAVCRIRKTVSLVGALMLTLLLI